MTDPSQAPLRMPEAPVPADLETLRAVLAFLDRALAGEADELTLPQLRALAAIAQHGPCRGVDLAVLLGIDPSSVSRLCARLEARGLVGARRSPTSRREIHIELTDQGGALLRRITAEGASSLASLLGAIDSEAG